MPFFRSVLLTVATLMALTACGKKQEIPAVSAPSAQPAAPKEEPPFVVVAHLTGSVETPVRTQVQGYLVRQAYKDGAAVKAGDLLFELDSRPFQKALNRAEAQLTDRRARLVPVDIIKEGVAQVNKAKSDLAATKIFAPADGVPSAARHGLGDMIPAGGTLAVVSQSDPIKAIFSVQGKLSADELKVIAKDMDNPLEVRPKIVELLLPDGTTYPEKGQWNSVDDPDRSSGPPTVSALFSNRDGVLQPGEDMKVRVAHP
jgi:membrane fusion protein (multidrug efflux system)